MRVPSSPTSGERRGEGWLFYSLGFNRERAKIPRTGNMHMEENMGRHIECTLMVAVLRLNNLDSGGLVRR